MKVTFILRGFSDQFFEGFGDLPGFNNLTDDQKLAKCQALYAGGLVDMKTGTGQFRDRVTLNQLMRQPHNITCSVSPRRGYMLASFDVVAT